VVLSGGSAFGISHIGVLKEIEKAGIPIDMILGTSMGSIVGGLYAAGYSPEEMDRIVTGIDWNSVFMDKKASPGDRFARMVERNYPLRIGLDASGIDINGGLLEGQNILSLFTSLTAQVLTTRNFNDLPVPYRAIATDIQNGEKVVIDRGSIAEAMRCSMSIPVIFMPYHYGDHYVVDGGIVDNLPVDEAKKLGADIVIAVVSHPAPPKDPGALNSSAKIAGQTAAIFIEQNMKPNQEAADLVIAPDLNGFSSLSFPEAKDLILRGEEAGQKAAPALRTLAARIAESRPLVTEAQEPNRRAFGPPPVFQDLRVEGGTTEDQRWVRELFAPLIGEAYSRERLQALIGRVYESGRFNLVKFDFERTPAGDPYPYRAVVLLVPSKPSQNVVFLGIDYQGSFSSVMQSDLVLSSALMLRGFTGPNSALLLSSSMVNRIRAGLEYFQPLGPLFIKPWLRYAYEYDVFASESVPITISSTYRTFGGGTWVGSVLGKDGDVMVGYSLENVLLGDNWLDMNPKNAGALRFSLRYDNRDSAVFSDRGVSFNLLGRWFDPHFGGILSFVQSEASAMLALPLGERGTLGLSLFGGTDFTPFFENALPAESAYFSTLQHPGMFYGVGYQTTLNTGNDVLALGLEYRYRIGRINSLMGGDVFLFGNTSVAGLTQQSDPATYDMFPLKFDVSLGAGARLSREFGLMTGVGFLGNLNETQNLGVSFFIGLGSFTGGRVEDKR
jgi:NTE family protein